MNTLNLATKNTTDFTVLPTGEAFISQVALGILCGVSQQALSKHIITSGCTLNTNDINQLDAKSLELVVGHYAQKGNIYHTLAWTTAYSDDRLN